MDPIHNNFVRRRNRNTFHPVTTLLLILCFSLPLMNCGGNSTSPDPNPSTNPTITSISPTSVLAGSNEFILTVNGTNFNTSSTIRWNGSSRTTNYVRSTQLNATIAASDISASGTPIITVRNTTPSIATSAGVSFAITNSVPTITSIYPSSIPEDSSGFTLIIYGTNFVTESSVQWGSSTITADYISSTQLSADIAATDISDAGLVAVSVTNPPPGGGLSNSVTFEVTPPGLNILTKNLPDAHNTKDYAYTLQAEGGYTPYTWTIQSGSLPAGLSLNSNGELSGNPPVVGVDTDFPVTVQITDVGSPLSFETQDLSIRVRNLSLGRNDICGPDTATSISDGVIRASISPYGDWDVYSFQGTAGNPVTIEIFAQRIPLYGNPTERDIYLDSFMEILDDSCSTLLYNDDIDLGVVLDSKISDYVLPSTGTYYVRVSDLRGDGRPDFQYELHLSGAD